MTKKIEWKESSIDYDALNKITDDKLYRIENGKSLGNLNKESGHLTEISKKGGKTTGKRNVENGHMKKIQVMSLTFEHQSNAGKKGGSTTGSKKWECPYCPKFGTGPAMTRWHMDNCKFK
jgi:general stress protein YciG